MPDRRPPRTALRGSRNLVSGPTAAETRVFYLSSLESANTCDRGELAPEAGQGEAAYTYDPDDPVPTRGGAGMLAFRMPGFGGAPPANVEQARTLGMQAYRTVGTDEAKDRLVRLGLLEVKKSG